MRYMIVGGAAVALYGKFRLSTNQSGEIVDKPDLDFWYDPSYESYFKILDVLEELGQDVARFREEQTPNPGKSFFRYEFENFSLDLLPQIKAPLKFSAAFKRKSLVNYNGTDIYFIGLDDLRQDKEVSGRPKDIDDIQNLES